MVKKKTVFNWQFYLGFVLVVTGGLFLADQLLDVGIMRLFWPLLIVLFGITFFVGMLVAGKRGGGLAIPGTLITTIGLLLFIQNTFNLWVTWTYAWALLISATGLGLLLLNIYHKRQGLRQVAGLIIGIGLVLFVFFGIFFEIILDIAGTDVQSGVFLGAGLVLLGFFVFFSRSLFARVKEKREHVKVDGGVVDVNSEDIGTVHEPEKETSQLITISEEFSGLHFKSVGEAFIQQGGTCEVKVEGSQDILNKVKTEVHDGELVITYQADVSDWTGLRWISGEHRVRYFLTVKDLKQINLAGAGSIRAGKLEGQSLRVAHSGVGELVFQSLLFKEIDVDLAGLGDVRVEGEVESQNVDLSGAGSYLAENLKSQETNIVLSGAGSARVWVESNLNIHVSGAGDIKYKGSPDVEQTHTGIGSIKPL